MRGSALHRNATLAGVGAVAATLVALLAEGHSWAMALLVPLVVVVGLEASARRNAPTAGQPVTIDLTRTRLDGTLRRIPSPHAPVVQLAPVRAARRPAERTVGTCDDGLAPVVQLRPVVRDERALRVNG